VNDQRFKTLVPSILDNDRLRVPQREAYRHIHEHFADPAKPSEVGIVLPVGCGKSGLITVTPFALESSRVLVVAPGLRIAAQLLADFDPGNPAMFYRKTAVLGGSEFPEAAEIRGKATNRGDLDVADVVVTNIHQLQGKANRWLQELPSDFFDLIIFDEAHHNVADSWDLLRRAFPAARIVNLSATPMRADGQRMSGDVIYSYPVVDAIRAGYVKALRAVVLNPKTLRYVRHEDSREIEVSLSEIRQLAETDAKFRRSIVSSAESLSSIVDASIQELHRLRTETGDKRLKIIASALNQRHCIQIKKAYLERNLRADFIHSKESATENRRILEKLENHELDVIVQVRMLGEGFDHPHLAVAAVFSVFRSLSPFAQFVGRIMRVLDQDAPDSPRNRGVVVFHAGSNAARVWSDFQEFSEADQEFFDQLLPLDEFDFDGADALEFDPVRGGQPTALPVVQAQGPVSLEEIPLVDQDPAIKQALTLLVDKGFTSDDFDREARLLQPLPVRKQVRRQATRKTFDDTVKHYAGRLLKERDVNPVGKNLDPRRRRTNLIFLKSKIDEKVNALVGRKPKERHDFRHEEWDQIEAGFEAIVAQVTEEVFGG